MAKKDANISAYKRLRAKADYVSGKGKDVFTSGRKSINQRLAPGKQAGPKKSPTKDYDKLLDRIQNDYNNKISGLEKSYNKKLADRDSSMGNTVNNMAKRQQATEKGIDDLGRGVSAELKKLYAAKAQQGQASSPATESTGEGASTGTTTTASSTATTSNSKDKSTSSKTTEAETTDSDATKSDEVKNSEVTTPTIPEQVIDETMSEVLDENGKAVPKYLVSKVLELKEVIQIGDNNSFRITNLYQPRSGKNYVAGKKKGKHARGVDVVSYDANGNKTNYPISIADGEIMNVGLHGSGQQVGSDKSELGYYVDIRLKSDPTKVIRYGHLDPGIMDIRKDIIGTSVARGDVIFEGGKMTGSGTAPHIKIYMSDLDENNQSKQNYTDKGNDPSHIIKFGT